MWGSSYDDVHILNFHKIKVWLDKTVTSYLKIMLLNQSLKIDQSLKINQLINSNEFGVRNILSSTDVMIIFLNPLYNSLDAVHNTLGILKILVRLSIWQITTIS